MENILENSTIIALSSTIIHNTNDFSMKLNRDRIIIYCISALISLND